MVDIDLDWTDPAAKPGIRHATVTDVQAKESKAGDRMLEITFGLDGGGRVRDFLMLEGGGKGMGMAKLERLGVPKGAAKIDTASLAGRELDLVLISDSYNGQAQLKVDSKANADGFRLGYGPPKPTPIPDSEVPF